MKYFLDTEFLEGFKKPIKWLPTIGRFNKSYHYIQLVSIGIVSEDGREYYAISNEFNPKDANDWVKENVLSKLPTRFLYNANINPTKLVDTYKSNKQIAEEIIHFTNPELFLHNMAEPNLEFYAYYADYDWVLFCSLFGTMMDLPKGFPMYCNDLKQMLDEWVVSETKNFPTRYKYSHTNDTFEIKLSHIKGRSSYPKQENEHSAIDDAKWNKKLYEFIQELDHNV